MQFTRADNPTGTVISLEGAFTFKDHHTFRALMETLRTAPGQRHVLDLDKLEFVDSAALGMLLIADEESRSLGFKLVLRRPSARVARLLELSAMDTIFEIDS
jgi:anti-anti-sigma factor